MQTTEDTGHVGASVLIAPISRQKLIPDSAELTDTISVTLHQTPLDRLREENEKAWHFWMYEVCQDPETGEHYGWGRVLDYIGVEWEDRYIDWEKRQMSIEDYLGNT